ncbi:MAG: hypothetical protein KKE30_02275 [Gammaproteobacteria bacterium]|nr:hypothetical protein [Gammaproteobacteria bacterium]MBU1556385.1 hypothetical protein [Gammaproteobacteria bacterium]MBU2068979.1 hypothetical protein [Gammaproteobacteria bacterium]MBU2183202.1 hypothetical protein [Gammaproteobacteria bacterium]MBU2204582.1 hypothetical protein [Gammaproteobacteria bacterium]
MAKNAKAVPEMVDNALILGDKAPPFSKEEVIQIIAHSKNLSQKKMLNLLAIEISGSFKSMGFGYMKEFIENQFDGKYKAIHHGLAAARVAYSFGGAELVEKYNDDAMRAMKRLDVEQRKDVFNWLMKEQNATKDTVEVTVKTVEEAITTLFRHKVVAKKTGETNWHKIIEKQADKFFEGLLDKVDKPLTLLATAIQTKLQPEQLSELIKLIQASEHEVLIKEGL